MDDELGLAGLPLMRVWLYGRGVSETELPRDHFVSRGYQQNFASPDKRVTVISAASGQVVDVGRPIKSNFREQGFTTFLEAGVPNGLLEKAFVSVERRVLNEIRNVDVDRCGPRQKADVANLFAIHLVRSPAFKGFYREIGARFRAVDVPGFVDNREYIERFEASEGRTPSEAELLEMALRAYDELATDPMSLVTTMNPAARRDRREAQRLPSAGDCHRRLQSAGIRDRRHPRSARRARQRALRVSPPTRARRREFHHRTAHP